jgi:hypothetical protein
MEEGPPIFSGSARHKNRWLNGAIGNCPIFVGHGFSCAAKTAEEVRL